MDNYINSTGMLKKRSKNGHSRQYVSDHTGISPSMIQKMENNNVNDCSLSVTQKWCRIYDIPIIDFVSKAMGEETLICLLKLWVNEGLLSMRKATAILLRHFPI